MGVARRAPSTALLGVDLIRRGCACGCLIVLARNKILPTTFLLYSLYNWARPNVGGYAKIPDSSINRQEEMGHR